MNVKENGYMRLKTAPLAAALVLSLFFTAAFFFVIAEVDAFLRGIFPDIFWQFEEREAFLNAIRPWGYASLCAVIVLIIAGFVSKRRKIALLGSISLFLPTFGYFALAMFFLAGIGIIRVLWYPIMSISPDVLDSCTIVYAPFLLLPGVTAIAMGLMIAGIFMFLMGVATWLYGKLTNREVLDFSAYMYSRHPQYLGYILWSYGVLIYTVFKPYVKGAMYPPPTLFWTISTLTVIAIALREEIDMDKRYGETYQAYRRRVPFLLPLPKFVNGFLRALHSKIIGKVYPENNREIVFLILLWLFISIVISLPFSLWT